MADLIDRQSVVNIAMCYCPDDDGSCSKADVDIRELLDDIENLPAINRWIPCRERQPDKDGRYYVTYKRYFTPDHVDDIDHVIDTDLILLLCRIWMGSL